MKPVHLAELNPKSLKEIAAEKPLILIPIGTIEWHANHLPLGVDSLLSQVTCDEISARVGCVVAPLVSCGICRNLTVEAGYYGSVDTIQDQTLTDLLTDLLAGYARMGFIKAVLLTGHFETDHWAAIEEAIEKSPQIKTVMLSAADFCADLIQKTSDLEDTWPFASDHAAEWETSLMLHYYPELVNMEDAPETIELEMHGIPEYLHRRYPRRATIRYGNDLARAIIDGGVKAIWNLLDH
jgi:creatinine amidohydrolase